MEKIVIILKDIDFYKTYMCVLKTLLTCHDSNDFELDLGKCTKSELLILINNLSFGCYLSSQFRTDMKKYHSLESMVIDDIKEYLKIDINDILINDEYLDDEYDYVDDYIILDTRINSVNFFCS